MNNIHWGFVIGATIVITNGIVALADILQGGVMWPCLVGIIALQGLAVLGVR